MSFNRVWSRFSSKSKDGSVLKLRIQDMPTDRHEDVIALNLKYFVPGESFHKAAGVHKSDEAIIESRNLVSGMVKSPSFHKVICCLDDEDDVGEIVGCSIMCITERDEHDDLDDLELKTNELKKVFEMLEGVHSLCNVMENFNLTKCYDGRGIVVHPDYRGLRIATEFCKVRRLICKDENVPMTAAWMTSRGSQKAAERDGWDTAYEGSIEELGRKHGVIFEDAPPTFKLMYARSE